ncbi:MAG: hypothetical protein KTR14_09180 [Vampirovibrio sp.]|nr:hypothetical protein [Vampirovibrio sp.]
MRINPLRFVRFKSKPRLDPVSDAKKVADHWVNLVVKNLHGNDVEKIAADIGKQVENGKNQVLVTHHDYSNHPYLLDGGTMKIPFTNSSVVILDKKHENYFELAAHELVHAIQNMFPSLSSSSFKDLRSSYLTSKIRKNTMAFTDEVKLKEMLKRMSQHKLKMVGNIASQELQAYALPLAHMKLADDVKLWFSNAFKLHLNLLEHIKQEIRQRASLKKP